MGILTPVRAELVDLSEISPPEIDRWRDLASRAAEPNPFFEPEFLLPARREVGSDAVRLLVFAEDDVWQACLPVAVERMFKGPRCLMAWQHSYLFLSTPLVDAARVGEFAEALSDALRARHPHRLLGMRNLGDGIVSAAIHEAFADGKGPRLLYEEAQERATLVRRPENDYLSAVKKRHLREMQRQRRRLGEELGGELEVVDRSDDPGAVDDFLRLEASGWKGQAGTAMAESTQAATFFASMCEAFASAGRLQMLSMQAAGRIAAMKCNISAGGTIFCFKIAHEDEFSRFSPGILLEAANIDLFHEQRHEGLMDSCAQPDNQMINRLWPDRRRLMTIALGPRGLSGSALALAGSAAQWRRDRRTNAQ